MNLGELRPAEGSNAKAWRRGRGHASGNGKQQVEVIKVRALVQAQAEKQALKAARCHFTEDFLREVLLA